MQDEEIARTLREAVAALNEALSLAARGGLAVKLRTTAHQTTSGVERLVADVQIFKRL
ncbi:hypothetical protein [Azospirillum sp. SYSU D00513]|uniref:hypothetical protein n=1 Tax=Azospirillum sp. SYSU D00513 TaxID=2812561 RepID=UPI001A95DEC7|nr:hypothetical protein [Azospirillum sp. SYSU D00513]